MREIKFRAWHKDYKEWLEKCDRYDKRKVNVYSFYSDSGWDFDDIIFMEYTGLKDKNGKEIYEGDIIKEKFEDVAGVVKFLDEVGSCGCCYPSFHGSGFVAENIYEPGEYLTMNNECEIIGNRYENPELVKAVV